MATLYALFTINLNAYGYTQNYEGDEYTIQNIDGVNYLIDAQKIISGAYSVKYTENGNQLATYSWSPQIIATPVGSTNYDLSQLNAQSLSVQSERNVVGLDALGNSSIEEIRYTATVSQFLIVPDGQSTPSNSDAGTQTLAVVDPYVLQTFGNTLTISTTAPISWWVNLGTVGSSLFTTGADTVNFGNLQPAQVAAINSDNGASMYNALGGNDNVTLPTEQSDGTYVLSPTVTATWDPGNTFIIGATSDSSSNTDTVTGSGDYQIQIVGSATVNVTLTDVNNTSGHISSIAAGSGSDTIAITGNGDNNITIGYGTDNVTINGTGANTISAGTPAAGITITDFSGSLSGSAPSPSPGATITLTGADAGNPTVGSNSVLELKANSSLDGTITFGSTAGGTLKIDGTTMPTGTIMGLAPGDIIDLTGVPYNTREFTQFLNFQQNQLELFAKGATTQGASGPVYQLDLDPSQNLFGDWFNISSDQSGGTIVQLLSVNAVQINIVENGTGYGTLSATVNGQTIPGMKGTVSIAYDDLMPVPSGTYTLYYRTNSHAGTGDALEFDLSPGVSQFSYARGVQIHIGNTPGDSAGCIVFGDGNVPPDSASSNAGSWTAFASFFDSVTSPTSYVGASGFYPAPVPINVTVSGDTSEPSLIISASQTTLQRGASGTIDFKVFGLQPASPVIDKDVNVYFQVLGTLAAQSLVTGAVLLPNGSHSNNGTALPNGCFETTIIGAGQNANPPGSADVAVTLNTAGIAASSVTINIVHYDGVSEETNGNTFQYDPSGQPLLYGTVPAKINIVQPTTSKLVDGYISGATVFSDANGTGQLASNDVSTTTDANGSFALVGGMGPLIAFGGTDISTLLPFKGQLEAPSGSTVIDPLTTLIVGLQSTAGLSVSAANQDVLAAFGLPSGVDLTALEPIAGAESGDAVSAETYVAGAKIIDTADAIASAFDTTGTSFIRAFTDAYAAFESDISAFISGETLNLANQGTIAAVIDSVGQTENVDPSSFVSGVAAKIAASNATLDQKLSQDGAGAGLITDVRGVQAAIQDGGFDPGPTAASGNDTVGHNQTVDLTSLISGLVAPGIPGDTETLTNVKASFGTGILSDGNVSYTAPSSGPDTLGYTVQDQYGNSASSKVNITVDPGPMAGSAHLYIGPSQSLDLTSALLALDTPGLPGDTLSLTVVGTTGTTGTATINKGDLSYTAPASGSTDVFTYTVGDQLGDTANGNVNVMLDSSLLKNDNITLTDSDIIIDGLNGKNIHVSLTGDRNTVLLGDGNDQVALSGNGNTAALGNGNDTVSAMGNNNTVSLGSGNDNVTVSGTGENITAGSRNDTFTLGASTASLFLHGLHDTVSVNGGTDAITDTPNSTDALTLQIGAFGGTVSVGNFDFAKGAVLLAQALASAEGWTTSAQIASALGMDGHGGSLLSLGTLGSIDFQNIPKTQLTASNFHIG